MKKSQIKGLKKLAEQLPLSKEIQNFLLAFISVFKKAA